MTIEDPFAEGLECALDGNTLTIPPLLLAALGITESGRVRIILQDGEHRVRAVPEPSGSPWAKALYDYLAPVRDAASSMSEEEHDEAINAAVRGVRGRTN